jgi:hypothetical protein
MVAASESLYLMFAWSSCADILLPFKSSLSPSMGFFKPGLQCFSLFPS